MIRKALTLVVVVYVFGVLWVSFFRESVPEIRALRKERDAWALKVARKEASNLELEKQIEGLQSHRIFKERIFREELFLLKKGDRVIPVPDDWECERKGS